MGDYAKLKVAAIIPARGGSKGIPKKNIIDLAGKPLVAWSIGHAKGSKSVGSVWVSTDDPEIAEVSKQYGAQVVVRPPQLATDTSPSEDALIHALDEIERHIGSKLDLLVFLQATSPVRDRDDIDNAVSKLVSEGADSLLSCLKLEDYFIWEERDGRFESVNYDYRSRKRRQDIKPQYLENGSIYVFKPDILRKDRNRLGGKITVYEMAEWKSHQIDDPQDIQMCEYYIKQMKLQ
jgi:CMP-N,N'-diacetyllegionaminic acid synthase